MKQKSVLILTKPMSHVRLGGIARFARTHKWHLVIADRLSRLPIGWTGDGALVSARGDRQTLDFIRSLIRKRIPVVDLTIDHPEIRVPRVSGDHAACGRLAAEHLLARHFRYAVWFSTIWSHSHALRFKGFADTWQTAIGAQPEKWVLSERLTEQEFDNWKVFTRRLATLLRKAPKPLAVLGYDDADAARVLTACLEADIAVPQDVAIMGIGDDTLVCENQAIPLSSIGHNLARVGYTGAALLDRLMSSSRKPVPEIVWINPTGIVARDSTDVVASSDPTVSAALTYIHENLGRPFGSAEIAEHLGISRTRLDRLFSAALGTSVRQEVLRLRIVEAEHLLHVTDLPLKTIAAQTGFSSPAHFSTAFSQATGISPSARRRTCGRS
ncbi:MAG: substrate-binding domain-containing protein [bacterium]|nr:substrate-binding domain-containing protein [bacterium]